MGGKWGEGFKQTVTASEVRLEHQSMVEHPLPYVCAKPYHLNSSSHGQLVLAC